MSNDGKFSFIEMEHDIQKFWQDEKIFEKLVEKNHGNKPFRFLDGPITANNPMGIHHAWGRSIKDVFLRYKAKQGHDCHYRNGFDAQGLWVEVEVEKELGFKSKCEIEAYGMDKFTRKCVERIKKFSGVIAEQSRRLGQWMDWNNSYFTHTDGNITGIWYFLKKCHERGWIKQSFRPMPWCPRCGTSLSEHEMSGSYVDITHRAVFIKLPLSGRSAKMLAWTTTPWTLTANVALAVNPEIDYCEVELPESGEILILAKGALGALDGMQKKVLRLFKGEELLGLEYETCFPQLPVQQPVRHVIIPWDAVDAKEGTGVVHIAPGCGSEDFELGKNFGLPEICPVDESGCFLENYGWLTGVDTATAAQMVFDRLEQDGKLFRVHDYSHSYPVCWRCKKEVIFRLVREWYIDTAEIKPQLIAAAKTVKWEPEYIGKRMQDWLENMGDWNISRKRYYGLPLPFYPCPHCGQLTVVGSKAELRELGGTAVDSLPELHRPWIDDIKIECPHCHKSVHRVSEVGDVWLDAGIVPFSTLGYFDNREMWDRYYPAEWEIEMREQVRLWFYSQLFMSVTLEGRAPYQRVLAHNSVISQDGTKFSKTGFMIRFDEAAEAVGADAIRYLFAGANMSGDVRFGYELGEDARRRMLGLWNVYSFFTTYADLDKPVFEGKRIHPDNLSDRWLAARTAEFVGDAQNFYDSYQSSEVVKTFENYIDDVSNWYIRINRRRFWKDQLDDDKLAAYYALFEALKQTLLVMAPVIPFVSEYIWQQCVRKYEKNAAQSVHLAGWPDVAAGLENTVAVLADTRLARTAIALALRLRNENQLKVRQPLACMYIAATPDQQRSLSQFTEIIAEELNVKKVEFVENYTAFNDYYLQLNLKKAGAVLKGETQKVKQALDALDDAEMLVVVERFDIDGTVMLPGWEQEFPGELFIRNARPKKDVMLGSEDGLTVAVDTKLNEELVEEGLYREIVRHCQVLRKDAGLKVDSRIVLAFTSTSERLMAVIKKFAEKIKSETLADDLTKTLEQPLYVREVDIDGEILNMAVAGSR